MAYLSVDEFLSYKSKYIAMPEELLKYKIYDSKKKSKGHKYASHPKGKNETSWLLNNKQDNSEFRSLLNKLSSSNSKLIYADIIKLDISNQLPQIIDILFTKALNDQKFVRNYAELCVKLSSKFVNFKPLLLEKTHKMFLSGINLKDHSDSNYKFKEQVLNCIEFIGELYNYDILTQKIIQSCYSMIFDRVKNGGLYAVDILSSLVKATNKKFCSNMNDGRLLFKQIEALQQSVTNNKEKFMLMDLVQLKPNNINVC